jgi:hypothetical protein
MTANFLENAGKKILFVLDNLGLAWWIEIVTDKPSCVYYFGPFVSDNEAKSHLAGYLEDIEQEDAQVIAVDIKQYQPKKLTVCEEEFSVNSLPN